jgi:hypothetical protein
MCPLLPFDHRNKRKKMFVTVVKWSSRRRFNIPHAMLHTRTNTLVLTKVFYIVVGASHIGRETNLFGMLACVLFQMYEKEIKEGQNLQRLHSSSSRCRQELTSKENCLSKTVKLFELFRCCIYRIIRCVLYAVYYCCACILVNTFRNASLYFETYFCYKIENQQNASLLKNSITKGNNERGK